MMDGPLFPEICGTWLSSDPASHGNVCLSRSLFQADRADRKCKVTTFPMEEIVVAIESQLFCVVRSFLKISSDQRSLSPDLQSRPDQSYTVL